MAYYLLYSVNTGESGASGSTFRLVSDTNGTPETTGSVILAGTGTQTLTAVLIDGVWKPNKSSWTDTVTLTNNQQLAVHVENAGTEEGRIWFNSEGNSNLLMFDAGSLEFKRSEAFPASWVLNNSGEGETQLWISEIPSAYTPSLLTATAVNSTAIQLTGSTDPRASSNILKWGLDEETELGELVDTTGEYAIQGDLPVVIAGLQPSETYYFQLVSSGEFGTAYSDIVSGTTNAAGLLTAPTLEIESGGADTTKKLVIGNVSNAAYFDIQFDTSSDFTDSPETVRVTNNNGAVYYARGLTNGSTYYFRVKGISASALYADSDWSQAENTTISGSGVPQPTSGEIVFHSNIYLDAVPTESNHLATVGKVTNMVNSAVTDLGTHVNSIAGLTGTITFTQLLQAGETSFLVQGSTLPAQSVLTASASDTQIASAKAIYRYGQNIKSELNGILGTHYHTYLYSPDGRYTLSAPDITDDATLLSDGILGPSFAASSTYQANDYVIFQGEIYQNTSGGTSTGNADFANKWEKKTLLELIQAAGCQKRYEQIFTGSDLNEDYEILINHNLGEQYLFAEVIDITAGRGSSLILAQINFTGTNQLKLTLSSSVNNTDRFKVILHS